MRWIIKRGPTMNPKDPPLYWRGPDFMIAFEELRIRALGFDTKSAAEKAIKRYSLHLVNAKPVRVLSVSEAKERAVKKALSAPTESGFSPWRFRDNPLEQRIASDWFVSGDSVLMWLLDPGQASAQPSRPCARDRWVAERIIQWLGSEVGQAFLCRCGFHKVDDGLVNALDVLGFRQ